MTALDYGVRRSVTIRLGKGRGRRGKEEQYMTNRNLYLSKIINLIEYIWRKRGRIRVPQRRKRGRIVEEGQFMPGVSREFN